MKKVLDKNTVLGNIKNKCIDLNLTFIGFYNDDNEYKNHKTKLILKCNVCGKIWNTKTYNKFMSIGAKCPNCVFNKKLTLEEKINFINKVCEKLNYTFLGFKENNKNLILKCNKCNLIWDTTTFSNFRKENRKHHSCNRKQCKFNIKPIPHEKIKEKLYKLLSFKDYKLIDIIGSSSIIGEYYIIFECNKCKKTFKYRYSTLYKNKFNVFCGNCSNPLQYTNNEAINILNEKCKLLNYTFIGFNTPSNLYEGSKTKLILKCNICNEIWNTTSFVNFVFSNISCPKCNNFWKMELEIENLLKDNNIEFEKQKSFNWLKYKNKLKLDFYLPKYNIAIECQGIQHFENTEYFGECNEQQKRDKTKFDLCKNNNIKIIYYSNINKFNYFLNEKIIKNKFEILNILKNE